MRVFAARDFTVVVFYFIQNIHLYTIGVMFFEFEFRHRLEINYNTIMINDFSVYK